HRVEILLDSTSNKLLEQAPTPTVSSQQPSQLNVQDKGKGKMVEPEPVKKLSKKVQFQLEQAPTPTVSSQQPSQLNVQDKGKGKMVEPEPVKKLSKKDQLMLDEELAFKLQAREEKEERLAIEKAQQIKEANIVS
ncbi:hypothetical protein Tco_0884933, partial [Tanacetum coccineum]